MGKQIQKIEKKLLKIEKIENRIMKGDFPKTGYLIMQYMEKRRNILESSKTELIEFNKKNMINFSL